MYLVLYEPNAETLLAPDGFQDDRVWPTCKIWQQYWHMQLHVLLSVSPLFQLKVDEFESNVNEIKDPYPSADFPGKTCPGRAAGKLGRHCRGTVPEPGQCEEQKILHQPRATEVLLAQMPNEDQRIVHKVTFCLSLWVIFSFSLLVTTVQVMMRKMSLKSP